MEIRVITGSENELVQQLRLNNETTISFAAMHYRSGANVGALQSVLRSKTSAVHMATSCRGVMSNTGLSDVSAFLISDPDGDYGTACAAFSGDTYAAANLATQKAIENADRVGEAPDLIWVSVTPGNEEKAIQGIEAVVGNGVPIIGGSAADDDVAGNWEVGDASQRVQSGVTVSVLFCSTPISIAYQNGYEPTRHTGVVTKSQDRCLMEIDGEPAADVYARWTNNEIPRVETNDTANILAVATLWPLGRDIGQIENVDQYLLAHPCLSHPDGSIDMFAEIETGETLTQMTGSLDALADRAGTVARFAVKQANVQPDQIAGALMVYCGGCRLAVEQKIETVYSGVNAGLAGNPFMGVFTFGEQGRVYGAGNKHGNLMISCVTFMEG